MKKHLMGVAALATSLLLAACGNSEANKLRGEFIKGCMSTGQDKSLCSCAFEKLEEKYPVEQLKRLTDASPEQVPESFMRDTMNGMLVCAGRPPLPEPRPAPAAPAPTQLQPQATTDFPASTEAQADGVYIPNPLPDGSADITTLDNGHPVKLAPGAYGDPAPATEAPPSN